MTIEKIKLDADAPQGSVNLTRLQQGINDSGLAAKFRSAQLTNNELDLEFLGELNSREQRVLMSLVEWSYEKAQPAAPGVVHHFDDSAKSTTAVGWATAFTANVSVIRNVPYLIFWTYEIGSYGWRDAKSRVMVDGTVAGQTQGSSGLFFNLNSYAPAAGSTLYTPTESKEIEVKVDYAATFLNLSARIRRIHFTVQQVKVG